MKEITCSPCSLSTALQKTEQQELPPLPADFQEYQEYQDDDDFTNLAHLYSNNLALRVMNWTWMKDQEFL